MRQAFLAVAAASLALMLSVRLADGSLAFLVQSWYIPVAAGAALVLAALAAAAAWPTVWAGHRWRPHATPASLFGAALVAAPLLLGLALKPEALGSANLSGGTDDTIRQFAKAPSTAGPADRNVYQWAYAFGSGDPRALIGQPVDVTGFVYHPANEPPGSFHVARFVVSCCVADATGTSIPVAWADASTLPADAWVRVTGSVALNPAGAAFVQASVVERVDAPRSPYIYP